MQLCNFYNFGDHSFLHMDEVVDQHWHNHTASKVFSPVNSNHKYQQHANEGTTQLDVVLGDILRPNVSIS